ncbi:MAG: DUF4101 domain-containing protein [Anaerolineae bacterium]|nr:DUF4101 domain-containing protein [Gloeobacterales cyanobacterium ES-bin-313]
MGVTGVVQQAGVLWYASEKGVGGIDLENRGVLAATPLDARCFLADSRTGLLLCGTGNGIFSYQGNRWQALKIDGTGPGSAVRALVVDSQKMIWCASNLGLGKMVGSFQTGFGWQSTYDTTDGLPSRRVDCLCVDNQSILWCGTPSGLARYQPNTDTFTVNPAIEAGVIALAADRQNQLFVATAEGLSKWDGKRWSELSGWRQHIAASAVPQCLLADDSGYLWCGTSAGLVVRDEGIWQGIDLGEPVSVYSLTLDAQGSLWCGTESGLFKVENWKGIPLKEFLERSVPASADGIPAQTPEAERPTTIVIPPSPTLIEPIASLQPTILNANEVASQPTVLNLPESTSLPTSLDTTNPILQPTILTTTEPSLLPTIPTATATAPDRSSELTTSPNSYIRLYASPTQSTIPIGGKEIFRIQVERQNTDSNISFADLLGSQGITATVIQKDASADWANLLVTVTEEAVPGNYTLRVQAEAPGITIYSCSVEIAVVPAVTGLTTPNALAPTKLTPKRVNEETNLVPLFTVLLLFLLGGGLIWVLGRSAGENTTSTTPTPETPSPIAKSQPTPVPQPEQPEPQPVQRDTQTNTQTEPPPEPQPKPVVNSNAFSETEAASLINNWQQIKKEIYSDPQNTDGESKLGSILTGVMLRGNSGNGGRLNSWQQLRSERQFWRYTQGSIVLVPGTFRRVDDHTAFAVIAITESGEKFDSAGNILKDAGSPYYNSTYQVKYRFAYDDQTKEWRLAECWGTTKTLRSCDLDRES